MNKKLSLPALLLALLLPLSLSAVAAEVCDPSFEGVPPEERDHDLSLAESCTDPNYLNICYFALDNEKEYQLLRTFIDKIQKLAPNGSRPLRVLEWMPEGTDSKRSFERMVTSGVKCQALIISGHHTGRWWGPRTSQGIALNDVENYSCNEQTHGFFKDLRYVWLQGCRTLGQEKPAEESAGQDQVTFHSERVARALDLDGTDRVTNQFRLQQDYAELFDAENPYTSRLNRTFEFAHIFGWTMSAPGIKSGSERSMLFHIANAVLDDELARGVNNGALQDPEKVSTASAAKRYRDFLIRTLSEPKPCDGCMKDGWMEQGGVGRQAGRFNFDNPHLNYLEPIALSNDPLIKQARDLDCKLRFEGNIQTMVSDLQTALANPKIANLTINSIRELVNSKNGDTALRNAWIKKTLRSSPALRELLFIKLTNPNLGLARKMEYYEFYVDIARERISEIESEIAAGAAEFLRTSTDPDPLRAYQAKVEALDRIDRLNMVNADLLKTLLTDTSDPLNVKVAFNFVLNKWPRTRLIEIKDALVTAFTTDTTLEVERSKLTLLSEMGNDLESWLPLDFAAHFANRVLSLVPEYELEYDREGLVRATFVFLTHNKTISRDQMMEFRKRSLSSLSERSQAGIIAQTINWQRGGEKLSAGDLTEILSMVSEDVKTKVYIFSQATLVKRPDLRAVFTIDIGKISLKDWAESPLGLFALALEGKSSGEEHYSTIEALIARIVDDGSLEPREKYHFINEAAYRWKAGEKLTEAEAARFRKALSRYLEDPVIQKYVVENGPKNRDFVLLAFKENTIQLLSIEMVQEVLKVADLRSLISSKDPKTKKTIVNDGYLEVSLNLLGTEGYYKTLRLYREVWNTLTKAERRDRQGSYRRMIERILRVDDQYLSAPFVPPTREQIAYSIDFASTVMPKAEFDEFKYQMRYLYSSLPEARELIDQRLTAILRIENAGERNWRLEGFLGASKRTPKETNVYIEEQVIKRASGLPNMEKLWQKMISRKVVYDLPSWPELREFSSKLPQGLYIEMALMNVACFEFRNEYGTYCEAQFDVVAKAVQSAETVTYEDIRRAVNPAIYAKYPMSAERITGITKIVLSRPEFDSEMKLQFAANLDPKIPSQKIVFDMISRALLANEGSRESVAMRLRLNLPEAEAFPLVQKYISLLTADNKFKDIFNEVGELDCVSCNALILDYVVSRWTENLRGNRFDFEEFRNVSGWLWILTKKGDPAEIDRQLLRIIQALEDLHANFQGPEIADVTNGMVNVLQQLLSEGPIFREYPFEALKHLQNLTTGHFTEFRYVTCGQARATLALKSQFPDYQERIDAIFDAMWNMKSDPWKKNEHAGSAAIAHCSEMLNIVDPSWTPSVRILERVTTVINDVDPYFLSTYLKLGLRSNNPAYTDVSVKIWNHLITRDAGLNQFYINADLLDALLNSKLELPQMEERIKKYMAGWQDYLGYVPFDLNDMANAAREEPWPFWRIYPNRLEILASLVGKYGTGPSPFKEMIDAGLRVMENSPDKQSNRYELLANAVLNSNMDEATRHQLSERWLNLAKTLPRTQRAYVMHPVYFGRLSSENQYWILKRYMLNDYTNKFDGIVVGKAIVDSQMSDSLKKDIWAIYEKVY